MKIYLKLLFSKFSIAQRLITGFSIVVILLVLSGLITLLQVEKIQEKNDLVVHLRTPTSQDSAAILNDINASLANLRGYMLTGSIQFNMERSSIWKHIDKLVKNMNVLSKKWSHPDDIKDWKIFKKTLHEFSIAQNKVQSIARTIDELPATKVLTKEITPRANIMLKEIENMIILELADQEASGKHVHILGMMAGIQSSLEASLIAIRSYLLTGENKSIVKYNKSLKKNHEYINNLIHSRSLLSTDQQKSLDKFILIHSGFDVHSKNLFSIRGSQKWNMSNYFLTTEVEPLAFKLMTILSGSWQSDGSRHGGMVSRQKEQLLSDADAASNMTDYLLFIQWALLLFGVFTGSLVSYFTLCSISPPVRSMTSAMLKLSKGDLDTKIPCLNRYDEIGAMAAAVQVFKINAITTIELENKHKIKEQVIAQDIEVAKLQQFAGMAEGAYQASLDLAVLYSHSEQVSESSKTIALASKTLVVSVDEIAQNSQGASEDAETTVNTVNQGRDAAQRVSTSITDISRTVEGSATSLEELTEASNHIEQILSVIQDIAEQTNLLALNATIEAARAGEAGKGFAVVATEVKGLAEQTSKATDDISQRINALKNGMDNISSTMDQSKQAVDGGLLAIEEAMTTMDQASQQVISVNDKMQEITNILSGQKSTSSEIADNIDAVAQLAVNSKDKVSDVTKVISNNNKDITHSANEIYTNSNDRSLCEMAKLDHVNFKNRIVDAMMGRIDLSPEDIPDHHNCRLGKWYDAIEELEVKSLSSFDNLVNPHKIVHAAAKRALSAHNSGDEDNCSSSFRRDECSWSASL